MLQITVNDKYTFDAENKEGKLTLNGEEVHPDLVRITDTYYHLLLNNRSYRLSIVERDEKRMVVEVNGNRYNIGVQDQYDLLLHALGMDKALSAQVQDIKAPMPGLVIKILVEPGEQVVKDAPLVILEAMKMENVLKAPAAGTVGQIKVKERDAVDKGQVLITFG